jgi:uncharacterized protein YcbK (DUF882 family)
VYHPHADRSRSPARVSPVEPSPHLPAAPVARPARRRLLGAAAALVAGAALLRPHPARATAAASGADAEARTLSFVHTHTGEQVSLVYATRHAYVPDALAALDWFLRDFRNAAVHPIDPGLFDQLHTLATITGTRTPFQVISGYRSPATNRQLRAQSGGVAERSLHLEGRAIDVRLADVPLADLRDAARSLRAGGVGYYAASQFVHLDTGAVRRW